MKLNHQVDIKRDCVNLCGFKVYLILISDLILIQPQASDRRIFGVNHRTENVHLPVKELTGLTFKPRMNHYYSDTNMSHFIFI